MSGKRLYRYTFKVKGIAHYTEKRSHNDKTVCSTVLHNNIRYIIN